MFFGLQLSFGKFFRAPQSFTELAGKSTCFNEFKNPAVR